MTPRILIIAGSDSGGGAGIQADIKTVTMLGGHAMTAITAITAQNTLGVQGVMPVPTAMVVQQMRSCLDDIGVDAVKIGMIGSAATARSVADQLGGLAVPIVFDPVMVATSGDVLADADTISAFERLMALATVVTPNLPELAALAGAPAHQEHEASLAAADLAERFGCAVLAKGGHRDPADNGYAIDSEGAVTSNLVSDILVRPSEHEVIWTNPYIDTRATHGTGCTLASAIAAGLGAGLALDMAVGRGIAFVQASLRAAPGLGGGSGPMGHQFVTGFGDAEAWPA